MADFRQGFFTGSRYEILLALGEEPEEYQRMMESLLEDLQPRPGLESHLAEQMGETFWRMRRAQRIRDGLALKSIQRKIQGEELMTSMQASKAFEMLEPFERLKEALSRRGQGPTAAEIEEFVKTRKGDSSERMQEFIPLLKSLQEPMEEPERKAARREARKHLGPLMEPYENLAWRYSRRSEKVHSPENLAALMAPEDSSRRICKGWRTPTCAGCGALSMLSGRSGKGYCKKKMLEKYERSQYVYENKQISDKMPVKKSDIYV